MQAGETAEFDLGFGQVARDTQVFRLLHQRLLAQLVDGRPVRFFQMFRTRGIVEIFGTFVFAQFVQLLTNGVSVRLGIARRIIPGQRLKQFIQIQRRGGWHFLSRATSSSSSTRRFSSTEPHNLNAIRGHVPSTGDVRLPEDTSQFSM